MIETLSGTELRHLVQRVFSPGPGDRALAIMADLPDEKLPDNPSWQERRILARQWARLLAAESRELELDEVTLIWYRNSGSNNADLPASCTRGGGEQVPASWNEVAGQPTLSFVELFQTHSLILAPTELSATAPLKLAARTYPFRAATMPGFMPVMIPALRLDYVEINRRVSLLKDLCDEATSALVILRADGVEHELKLDLRYRTAHASGGLLPRNGMAGNLPSGEAYIVPYEGERASDPSSSAGTLPVQIEDEVVIYEIAGNRAVRVLSTGPESERESERLRAEPAYANLAELGLGVLGDFGLKPVGSILLDEKLGLHIAFGRSDHFGGAVGPDDFSSPEAVIHLDRVYIPETQPRVAVVEVSLHGPAGDRLLLRDGRYAELF